MTTPSNSTGRNLDQLHAGLASIAGGRSSGEGWTARDLEIDGPAGRIAVGRSTNGDVGVLIPLSDRISELPSPSRRIRISRQSLSRQGTTIRYLAISCNDPENERRFLLFCADLIDQGPFVDASELTAAIARSVQRFRSLLYPEDAADMQAAIGLLGEMLLLNRLASEMDVHASQWTGPAREARDIDLGYCQLEVKTTSQLTGWRLQIHGLHQLAPTDIPLVLIGMRVAEDPGGRTLSEVADWLRTQGLGDPQRLETIFESARLAACESALESRKWALRDMAAWRISPEFPRIEPSVLSGMQHLAALDRVQYVLDLTTEPEADAEGESAVLALIKGLR